MKPSPNLFARKLDQTIDGETIGVLERHLAIQAIINAASRRLASENAAQQISRQRKNATRFG